MRTTSRSERALNGKKLKNLLQSSLKLFFALVILIGQTGCVTTHKRREAKPWSGAFVYDTDHYTVYTNTSPEVAEYIAELMEKASRGYREVTGYEEVYLPKFTINAYATKVEYNDVARKQGFPKDVTRGLYAPAHPAAIHLPYIQNKRSYPSGTLLHEGVHQFLDQTMSFNLPSEARRYLPPEKHKLLSLPLWLNEGLATYMESSIVNENQIDVGRINRGRLKHLQKLIRRGRHPSLREVLSKRYGEPFSADDYAVSWGIVYALRHMPDDIDKQTDRRERLKRYLEASKDAFYDNPDKEFMRDFIPNNSPLKDLDYQWYAYVSNQSLVFFERIIVEEDTSLEEWEKEWAKQISKLNP